MKSDSICFPRDDFKLYVLTLWLLLGFFGWIIYVGNRVPIDHKPVVQLPHTPIDPIEKPQVTHTPIDPIEKTQVTHTPMEKAPQPTIVYTTKMDNTQRGPERIYPGGRLNIPANTEYQQIGFLFSPTDMQTRYPLYGRPRYPGRTDKYEYYVMDASRHRLKIAVKTKNYEELYDNDSVSVPELHHEALLVRMYDFMDLRRII